MRQLDPHPGGLQLRRMLVADLDAVMKLNLAAFKHAWSRDQFERELGHEWSTVLLAGDVGRDGALVGFVVFWVVHDELHILNVATDPACLRRGVASALLEESLKLAAEKQLAVATLEVRRSNAPAQALYAKFGFEVVGVRPHYYTDQDEDAIIMTRHLTLTR